MPEDLKPSIEIKQKQRNGETYSVIAYDGIQFDDYLMDERGAADVCGFLRHAVDRGWELSLIYKPE